MGISQNEIEQRASVYFSRKAMTQLLSAACIFPKVIICMKNSGVLY
jgi:hypothetical protein